MGENVKGELGRPASRVVYNEDLSRACSDCGSKAYYLIECRCGKVVDGACWTDHSYHCMALTSEEKK